MLKNYLNNLKIIKSRYLASKELSYNDEQEANGLTKLELIGAVDIRYA